MFWLLKSTAHDHGNGCSLFLVFLSPLSFENAGGVKHGSAVPDSRASGDLGRSLPAVPQQSESLEARVELIKPLGVSIQFVL